MPIPNRLWLSEPVAFSLHALFPNPASPLGNAIRLNAPFGYGNDNMSPSGGGWGRRF